MLVLVGAAVAIGGKVLDLLFGQPEPFEFTGSTQPGGHDG
jgi:hypothetical protein